MKKTFFLRHLLTRTALAFTIILSSFALQLIVPRSVSAQINLNEPPTSEDLDELDPLKIGKEKDILNDKKGVESDKSKAGNFKDPGSIVTQVIIFAFPLAGLILFLMIIWGGFEMLSGAATSKSKEAGRQRITAAVTGFFLLFAAYWIAQILEAVFGVTILGG